MRLSLWAHSATLVSVEKEGVETGVVTVSFALITRDGPGET